MPFILSSWSRYVDLFRRLNGCPNHRLALVAFIATIPLHLVILYFFPNMNYFVRAGWVIVIALSILNFSSGGWRSWKALIVSDSVVVKQVGWGLLGSLILLHFIFH